MINIDNKNLSILNTVLAKYDYSFYLFGSRITNQYRKYSDVDIFYRDSIPDAEINKLEEEFEESELAYKVDLIDYNNCNLSFQKVMRTNYICIKRSSKLCAIENASANYFEFFPKNIGLPIVNNYGVTIINSGLNSSKFNICYGRPQNNSQIWPNNIKNIIKQFKGQNFTWWLPDSHYSAKFTMLLKNAGFKKETTEHAMFLNLADYNITNNNKLIIKAVSTLAELDHFTEIISKYEKAARKFYTKITITDLEKAAKLFVAYKNDIPVTIATLFEYKNIAIIFKLIMDAPTEHSYCTSILNYLLKFSKNNNFKYSGLLTASTDLHIYKKLGFKKIGEFECYKF